MALLVVAAACDPAYRLWNVEVPSPAGVVRYRRAGYELEAPAELHGLAGNYWLYPRFAVSHFSDTLRVETAWLSARGQVYEAIRQPTESLTFAPGVDPRPLDLEWRFQNQGVSTVIPDSGEFVVVVRVGTSPPDSVQIRYRTRAR